MQVKMIMMKTVNKTIFKNPLKHILLVIKLLSFIDPGCCAYKIVGTSQNTNITNNSQVFSNETDTISPGMQNKHDVHETQADKLINTNNPRTKTIQNLKRIYPNETAYINVTDHTNRRRSNNFEEPVDINDSNFQRLLDKYRGMVHKFNAPPNQQEPPNHPSDNFPVPQDFALTTNFYYSTTPANRGYYGYSQPALIRGRAPKWGVEVGRQPPSRDEIWTPTTFTRPTTPRNWNLPPDSGKHGRPGDSTAAADTTDTNTTDTGHGPKYTTPTTRTRRPRSTPPRVSFDDSCDYIAYYCLKAYVTGKICGRTIYNHYITFESYCLMDFVNCKERFEVWQIVHMGECFELQALDDQLHYGYHDDHFLDEYYVTDI